MEKYHQEDMEIKGINSAGFLHFPVSTFILEGMPTVNHNPCWYSIDCWGQNKRDDPYAPMPIFHIKDLVNWKHLGPVLESKSQLKLTGSPDNMLAETKIHLRVGVNPDN